MKWLRGVFLVTILIFSFTFLSANKAQADEPPLSDPKIFWIAPIWHRLDSIFATPPYPNPNNFWGQMANRLGGNSNPYIKIALTASAFYLNDTTEQVNDWHFKPDVVDSNKAAEHKNDNINKFYDMAKTYNLKVAVNLIGEPWGEWSDCPNKVNDSCSDKNNNVGTFLEQNDNNVQWTQNNQTLQERIGFGPPLQRNLTMNVYNQAVRTYIKRNLQEAVHWVWDNPERRAQTIGFSIDPDSFLTIWDAQGAYFDYNPGSIVQFREWMLCSGVYSSTGPYYQFRRQPCLSSVSEINQIFDRNFTTLDAIDPPRPTGISNATDLWWQEWTKFRQHQVFLHNWEKMKWVEELGVPPEMIYGHPGVSLLDPVNVSDFVAGRDQSGATIQLGGIPPFGNGTNLYGQEARNENNAFFQKIKAVNPNWVVMETSPISLSSQLPATYEESYRSIQQYFLHGAKIISPLAWHVNYFDGGNFALGPTKVRDTAYEDAIRDFVKLYGAYPRGDMAWEFGKKSSTCVDKTGVTKKPGSTAICDSTDQIDHTNLEDWSANNQVRLKPLQNGTVTYTVEGNDPSFLSPTNLAFSTTSTNQLNIKMKFTTVSPSSPHVGEIFWQTEESPGWNSQKSITFLINPDSLWHDYEINVGVNANWTGKLSQFRVDTGTTAGLSGSQVEIDFIWLQTQPTVIPTPTPTPLAGDLNDDGRIDISDYTLLMTDFGKSGTSGFITSDLNPDGKVDIFDYTRLVGNFGLPL